MLFSSTDCIVWLAVYFTESVAIVTLNVVTIIVFMKSRSLRKRSLYLVINLALADMLCGGFSQAMDFSSLGADYCNFWKANFYTKRVTMVLHTLFPLTSLLNITVISLERVHATFRPFRHRIIKGWVYGLIILLIWVTALVLSLGVWLQIFESMITNNIWIWVSVVCLFVICVCYASITLKMSCLCCGARPQHHGAANREKKLTCTLFIMTLVSLLMWLPWTLYHVFFFYIYYILIPLSRLTFVRLYFALKALMYVNSLVNPIIYTIRMPEFKRALVSLLRGRSQQVQVEIPLQVM